jgi:hypothetical protein
MKEMPNLENCFQDEIQMECMNASMEKVSSPSNTSSNEIFSTTKLNINLNFADLVDFYLSNVHCCMLDVAEEYGLVDEKNQLAAFH